MTVRGALLVCELTVLTLPAPAQEKSDRLQVVNCFDADRNIVRRTAR